MLTLAENRLLTQTGDETPMGQYFRQFLQPIALSRELPEPDCAPIRLTILGESLIAFRDSLGRVGLVEPTCPHRGADLFYGRNEACGLRCIYHGWKFDIHGKAVDLPNVPPGSGYHETMRIRAYPTAEFGEMVWAYLGPALQGEPSMPAVPQLEFGLVPDSHRYVTKRLQQCNWAQSIEGALDTAHFSFLHMPAPSVASNENPDAPADARRLRWIREDPMPRFSIIEHDVGFVVGAARHADANDLYWRITQFMLPAHSSTLPTHPQSCQPLSSGSTRTASSFVHRGAWTRRAGCDGSGQSGSDRRSNPRTPHRNRCRDRAFQAGGDGRRTLASGWPGTCRCGQAGSLPIAIGQLGGGRRRAFRGGHAGAFWGSGWKGTCDPGPGRHTSFSPFTHGAEPIRIKHFNAREKTQ